MSFWETSLTTLDSTDTIHNANISQHLYPLTWGCIILKLPLIIKNNTREKCYDMLC